MAYTTINKSTDYFNTKLYTGNGSTQSITGVGFQPDWTWIKNRSADQNHSLTDSVRGVTKTIRSDVTTAETTDAQGQTAFGSDGFTVGSEDKINGNGNNIVAWNWKAGNSAGSSNTDGSITSTVSVNTTAGFSIIKYTATGNVGTIGHGLGAVPKMLIFKDLDDTGGNDWYVHHTSTGVNGRLILNANNAVADNTNFLNQVLPTSTLITLGTTGQVNNVGNDFICYAFSSKIGYSKFGSYTGNGNVNGTFIYTGFKPAFVILKRTNTSNNWIMFDNKRDPYNEAIRVLFPNTSDDEDAGTGANDLDFLSNGIKIREDNGECNGSGDSYIYMAFAEAPLVGSNNVPCTAR